MRWYLFKLNASNETARTSGSSKTPKKTAANQIIHTATPIINYPTSINPIENKITESMDPVKAIKIQGDINLNAHTMSIDNRDFWNRQAHKLGHIFKEFGGHVLDKPVVSTLTLAQRLVMFTCLMPINLGIGIYQLFVEMGLLAHFSGAMTHFDDSMNRYGKIVRWADTSFGDPFIWKSVVSGETAKLLLKDIDDKFTQKAKLPEDNSYLSITEITEGKDKGKHLLKFSYAVDPQHVVEFDRHINKALAAVQTDLEKAQEAGNTADIKKWTTVHGNLKSIRVQASRRGTLPMAGKRQRAMANRRYYELNAKTSQALREIINQDNKYAELRNNAGWNIHENSKGILVKYLQDVLPKRLQGERKDYLQINYLLRRQQLNLLTGALREAMQKVDSETRANKISDKKIEKLDTKLNERIENLNEKIRIGYKIVETNFCADIHGQSFLSLPPDQRIQAVAEVSTFTSMPAWIAHNILYSSIHQLDTTHLRMVLNIMNNATNSFDPQSLGLGAFARELEALMNAAVGELKNITDGKGKPLFIDKDGNTLLDINDNLRSHNYYELALLLVDIYGRHVTPNVKLAEAIQRAFPADGAERSSLVNALMEIKMYNNIDGHKYLYWKGEKICLTLKELEEVRKKGGKGVLLEDILNELLLPVEGKGAKSAFSNILKNIKLSILGKNESTISAEQIHNFVTILQHEIEIQEQAPAFAAIINEWHCCGQLNQNKRNELKTYILKRFAIDDHKKVDKLLQAFFNNDTQQRVMQTAHEYTSADLGGDKINNINADYFKFFDLTPQDIQKELTAKLASMTPEEQDTTDMSKLIDEVMHEVSERRLEEFTSFIGYSKGITFSGRKGGVAYVTEVLEGRVDMSKFDEKRFNDDLGTLVGSYVHSNGGKDGGKGGLEEALRWSIEYFLRQHHALKEQRKNSDNKIYIPDISAKRFAEIMRKRAEELPLSAGAIKLINEKYPSNMMHCEDRGGKNFFIYRTNSEAFQKLANDTRLSEKDRGLLTKLWKEGESIIANYGEREYSESDERQIMRRTVSLTDTAMEVIEKYRFHLEDIEVVENKKDGTKITTPMKGLINRWREKGETDAHFRSLSVFDQYRVLVQENQQAMKKELLAEFASELDADQREALVDDFMDIFAEGEMLQQSVARGLIAQTNRIISDQRKLQGQDLLIDTPASRLVKAAARERTDMEKDKKNMTVSTKNNTPLTKDEKASLFKALNAILSPYGGKVVLTKPPAYQQFTYREVGGAREKGSLAQAIFNTVHNYKPGKPCKDEEQCFIPVSELMGAQDGRLGGEALKQNYSQRKMVILTTDPDSTKRLKRRLNTNVRDLYTIINSNAELAEILKKMSVEELQKCIDAEIDVLEARSEYNTALESCLEYDHDLMRDNAVVAANMLGKDLYEKLETGAATYIVDDKNLGAVDFVRKYHIVQERGGHFFVDKQGKEELFADRIMKNYINAEAARDAAKSTKEPETMFYYMRFSPDDDQNGKPGVFNMAYVGVTPFENMQKIIKAILLWYSRDKGAYSFTQQWNNYKDKMRAGANTIAADKIYHRGNSYSCWDLLDKVFAEMDELKATGKLSLKDFDYNQDYKYNNVLLVPQSANESDADFAKRKQAHEAACALDMKRSGYDVIQGVFQKIMPKVLENLTLTSQDLANRKIELKKLKISREEEMAKGAEADKNRIKEIENKIKEIEEKIEIPNTLTKVITAGRTMRERMKATFQSNMDKDNILYLMFMSMILNIWKPNIFTGDIINEKIVLGQPAQDLYGSLLNWLQRAALIDMHDFRSTEIVFLTALGFVMDQGCFNARLGKWDTYIELMRLVREIGTPVNDNPPPLLAKLLGVAPVGLSIWTIGAVFNGLMLAKVGLLATLFAPQVILPLLMYVAFRGLIPRKTMPLLSRLYRKATEGEYFLAPMNRATFDISVKDSAVEDYSVHASQITALLMGIQVFSMMGAALAESDHDVQAEVQFPRWNLAHLEQKFIDWINSKFTSDLIEREKLADDVFDPMIERFKEAAQADEYPTATMHNLKFSTIMAVYAMTGLSIFAFAGGIFFGLFGGLIPTIAIFSAISIANYLSIRNYIRKHHHRIGISFADENIAEGRSNVINSILVPKILNVAVSLAKMPFITSEPVRNTMRRWGFDLLERQPQNRDYAREAAYVTKGKLKKSIDRIADILSGNSVSVSVDNKSRRDEILDEFSNAANLGVDVEGWFGEGLFSELINELTAETQTEENKSNTTIKQIAEILKDKNNTSAQAIKQIAGVLNGLSSTERDEIRSEFYKIGDTINDKLKNTSGKVSNSIEVLRKKMPLLALVLVLINTVGSGLIGGTYWALATGMSLLGNALFVPLACGLVFFSGLACKKLFKNTRYFIEKGVIGNSSIDEYKYYKKEFYDKDQAEHDAGQ